MKNAYTKEKREGSLNSSVTDFLSTFLLLLFLPLLLLILYLLLLLLLLLLLSSCLSVYLASPSLSSIITSGKDTVVHVHVMKASVMMLIYSKGSHFLYIKVFSHNCVSRWHVIFIYIHLAETYTWYLYCDGYKSRHRWENNIE